jgi:non-ribosomal peptide synthetase component F
LTDKLIELSRNEGATLFMVLLTAYQAVLARYADNDDVVVGTDIANRGRVETEPLIGFFVNQLAIRTNFSGASTFREMLKRVRQSVLDAYLNQDLPFEKVVDELQVERRPGRHPIFQVKLTLQNMPRQSFDLPDVDVDVISLADGPPKMDMILIVGESEEGLTGLNTYNSELYSAVTIRALTQLYRALLTVLASDVEMLKAPRPELFHATELKLRDGLQAASPLQPSRMRARVGHQAVDA